MNRRRIVRNQLSHSHTDIEGLTYNTIEILEQRNIPVLYRTIYKLTCAWRLASLIYRAEQKPSSRVNIRYKSQYVTAALREDCKLRIRKTGGL